jgi:mannitol-specific phosphotransferase system IIBC component
MSWANLLGYGVSGFGLALAILTFRLLSAQGRRPKPQPQMLVAIYVFMTFSLALVCIGLYSEYSKLMQQSAEADAMRKQQSAEADAMRKQQSVDADAARMTNVRKQILAVTAGLNQAKRHAHGATTAGNERNWENCAKNAEYAGENIDKAITDLGKI